MQGIDDELTVPVKRVAEAPPDERSGAGVAGLLSSRVADVVAAVVSIAACASVFVAIHEYGRNILYGDQWMDVALVHRAHTGTLTWGALWAQHNENRILFPNLVVLALASTTHLQVLVEDYLSGVALCGATALVVLAHHRRSPDTPWIVYTPVVLVLLSGSVVSQTMFGFNFSWFLVLLALAAAVYLADRPLLTRLALAGAVAAAVVGSYSSLQGLIIWPAVLVLLWQRRRSPRVLGTWVGCAVVTTAFYLYGFDRSAAGAHGTAGGAWGFFVVELGNVFGTVLSHGSAFACGIAVLVLAVAALVVGRHRDSSGGAPVGVALVVFGLVFAASAGVGRASLGVADALRYSEFVLTAWVGAYLVLVSGLALGWRRSAAASTTEAVELDEPAAPVAEREREAAADGRPTRSWRSRQVQGALAGVLLALMVVQFLLGHQHGTDDDAGWRAQELTVADITANVGRASDFAVADHLGPYSVPELRQLVADARSERLSLFATSLATTEARRGISPPLLDLLPTAWQRVRGTVEFDAGVQTGAPVRIVFEVRRDGRTVAVVPATPTPVGLLGRWDPTGRPIGLYWFHSVATAADGSVTMGDAVPFVLAGPGRT